MKMTLREVLVLVGLAAVLAHPETQDQCPHPQVSAMRVTVRTIQNKTGHWDTEVSFKQKAAGGSHVWMTDVDQNVFDCSEEHEPMLETVLNLRATPRSSTWVGPTLKTSWSRPWSGGYRDVTSPPPVGYEHFPGVGYYKFHTEWVSWAVAHRSCMAEGGHLVIINSERERLVVKQIFARHPSAGEWFHAGILEFGAHAEWFTVFGEPLASTGFVKIYPGEDNALGISDFGCLHKSADGYGDGPISNLIAFLCEFQP